MGRPAYHFIGNFFRKFSPMPGGCWKWIASINKKTGYAMYRSKHKSYLAHRVSYTIHKGPIPVGKYIDHLCRNRWCVNPTHLEAVTSKQNINRVFTGFLSPSKRTHCPKGHKYNKENTWILKCTGERRCRLCMKIKRIVNNVNYRTNKH